jgi:hypothetical protein
VASVDTFGNVFRHGCDSRIATCSSVGYGGPDGTSASVTGTCTDNAGNVGSGVFSFRYDATAPGVSGLRIRPGEDRRPRVEGNPRHGARRGLALAGRQRRNEDRGLSRGGDKLPGHRTEARTQVPVHRRGVRRGREQSNSDDRVRGPGRAAQPCPAGIVSSPPLLVWTAIRGATYYNVVLIRGEKSSAPGRLSHVSNSRGPGGTEDAGNLRPGIYCWDVWPGYGRLRAGRFGPALGGSTFIVTR